MKEKLNIFHLKKQKHSAHCQKSSKRIYWSVFIGMLFIGALSKFHSSYIKVNAEHQLRQNFLGMFIKSEITNNFVTNTSHHISDLNPVTT